MSIFSAFTVSNAKAVIENKKILKGTNYTCSDHNKLWYESLSFAKEGEIIFSLNLVFILVWYFLYKECYYFNYFLQNL